MPNRAVVCRGAYAREDQQPSHELNDGKAIAKLRELKKTPGVCIVEGRTPLKTIPHASQRSLRADHSAHAAQAPIINLRSGI